MSTDTVDTVVVGGGVAGCMSAYCLANRSDRDVLVLEKEQVAAEATGLSAGLVAPSMYFGEWPTAARYAVEFFESFDGTGQFKFTRRPRLDFCSPDEESAYRERAARLSEDGFPVAYRSAAAVEETYPHVRMDDYVGANVHRDAGWVDPYSLATTLEREAVDRGVEVRTGVAVESVLSEGGRVTGVETDAGRIETDTVVVAAGWRSASLLDDSLSLPVKPYKTPCVVLDTGTELGERFPLGRVSDGRYLYFRPEHNGDLLVGGGEKPVENPGVACRGTDVEAEFTRYLATKLPRVLDGASEMKVVDSWAGVDGATPDGRAILDAPAEAPNGLVVATGFNGLGIMCSPIAGDVVSALALGEEPTVPRTPFRLDRFDDCTTEFEFAGLHHSR